MLVLNCYCFYGSKRIHFDYKEVSFDFKGSNLSVNAYFYSEYEPFLPVWDEPDVKRVYKYDSTKYF